MNKGLDWIKLIVSLFLGAAVTVAIAHQSLSQIRPLIWETTLDIERLDLVQSLVEFEFGIPTQDDAADSCRLEATTNLNPHLQG